MNLSKKRRFVFGPVPSRRLGRSLGIDLTPRKTCSFDCLYCECGRTTNLVVSRSCFAEPELVVKEVKEFITSESSPPIDAVTFSGSGEPTLYIHIGRLISEIKALCPGIPVGVLTNGSLFWDQEVRKALLSADFVIPSLDAPNPELWQRINRPHPSLSWEQYIEGLVAFRKEYPGSYILEIFLLKGLNDAPEVLEKFKELLGRIEPDLVDLNTFARPGTEPGLVGLKEEELETAARILLPFKSRIIGHYRKRGEVKPDHALNMAERIIGVISRRPCTVDELADSMALSVNGLASLLEKLVGEGRVNREIVAGRVFYSARSE